MNFRRFWRILEGNSVSLHPSLRSAMQATDALIKFCNEHDGEYKVAPLKKLWRALEADDRQAAIRAFRSIPLGGNGSFADWFPPVKFANETDSYVQQVFISLTAVWYEHVSDLLEPKK